MARKKKSGESLATQAYHALEEMITTLKLEPGTVLSEQQLAGELGVGRSPVREALQRLAHEGLVVVLPRRGILVSDINVGTHRRLLEARRDVERLLVRLACRDASEDQRAGFQGLAQEFEKIGKGSDATALMRIDAQFNDLVANSVDNEFAVKSIKMMRGLTRRFWYKYYKRADISRCAMLHADLARAISKRETQQAADALDRLIDYMEEFTLATLDLR